MTRFADRLGVGALKETAEGYLVATSRVARTGIQLYRASEIWDAAEGHGFKPDDVVRVYRSPEQVFDEKSLSSITRIPITLDHPTEDVNSSNWGRLAKGEVGDSYALERGDPGWVVINPMLKDSGLIAAAKTTHPEWSMGYKADIVPFADKSLADFEMVGIRYNHVAAVPRGRAGPEARIGDSWGVSPVQDFQPGELPNNPKGVHMDLKTVVLGDKAVQVAVADVAAIEQYKAQATKALADAEAAKKKSEEDKDEEIGALKAKLKKAEDAALVDVDALVAARTALVAQVHAIDSSIAVAGKTDAELRKTAVAKRLGDAILVDSSDAEITGMFKALAKDAKPGNPAAAVFRDGVHQVGDAAANEAAALAKNNADRNAWRNQ